MKTAKHIVVIGAGIVGVSTAIWLRRAGLAVTLIDRNIAGKSTSYGNAGVLASCSVAPVTAPGLLLKGPKLLLDPNFPLFMRWSYLPRLAPWLVKYMSHANDKDTRRIAKGLAPLTSDSLDQHLSLVKGTGAENWMVQSDYSFAYASRAAFEDDAYTWELRRQAGFEPELIEGSAVQDFEPMLAPDIKFLAVMHDHGFVRNPGEYIKALASEVLALGGKILHAEVKDFTLSDGKVSAVQTSQGEVACSDLVVAAGIWSKPLAKKLGLVVPMESERGYHIIFKSPNQQLGSPMMIAGGKFVATPMSDGLRCAGIVEFGGLQAGASAKPLKLLRRKALETFPNLEFQETETWLGHRPAPADSLPLIGEIGASGVIAAFGHHHIGLTSGPKTGRLVADLLAKGGSNLDLSAYSPNRF